MLPAMGCLSSQRNKVWWELFVLALRGRLVGLPGDRLDSQRGHVDDELALHPTARGVQRGSVVGEQTLWSSATRGALVEHRDRCFSGLAARHVRGDREARMIVLELEDHAGPAVGEDVLGRIQLPARVRCRIDEPPPGRARPLPRLQSSHASFAEDPCQGRDRWRFKSHRFHPVVDADRTVIQPRRFECGADLNSLVLDLFIELARGGMWSFGAGLEHGRGPIDAGASTEDVERLARDAVLDAERAHRPTRRVIRPPRDGQADSGIDGLVSAHRPFLPAKCHHQEPRKCHRCPDTELSPMSCDITNDDGLVRTSF